MSVNEKLKDAEAGSYGSIAPEPENDAVAYVKRHTIALGALSVLAFGAAVALTTGPPPRAALASGGYLVGGMLMDSDNSIPECASQDSGCLYNALDAPGFPASSFGIIAAGNFGPQGCDLAPGEGLAVPAAERRRMGSREGRAGRAGRERVDSFARPVQPRVHLRQRRLRPALRVHGHGRRLRLVREGDAGRLLGQGARPRRRAGPGELRYVLRAGRRRVALAREGGRPERRVAVEGRGR